MCSLAFVIGVIMFITAAPLPLIVGVGYFALLRRSGKVSFGTIASSMPLFQPGYFGAGEEPTRRRLARLMVAFFLLLVAGFLPLFLAAAGNC
jgi:hypothetical protein